jgi:dihydroorotate dehydrogenase
MNIYADFLKPLLFNLDPELAHELTVKSGLFASSMNSLFSSFQTVNSKKSAFNYKNLHFQNRVGLAAGFDKNALYFRV